MKQWEVTIMNEIFEKLLENDKEFDLPFETKMVMYRFLSEIDKLAEEMDFNKKQLAEKIGTSASFITQLFKGNKILNLETIAKFQHAFDVVFEVKVRPRNEYLISHSSTENSNINNSDSKNDNSSVVLSLVHNTAMYVVPQEYTQVA